MSKNFEHEKPCTDHTGKKYSSITEMCNAYGIKPETYSLTTPVKPNGGQYCYDHEGTRFKSESLMCKHWGINRKTYRYRRNNGLSVEEALTSKPTPGQKYKPAE